jgi:hypothetical protein
MEKDRERDDTPIEQPAVCTTIVGGRPPGPGKGIGSIPRGIEVLVKKASVDPHFKKLLLANRAEAAKGIELELDAAEAAMLESIPSAQLEAIIAHTTVSPKRRAAFLGRAAAVMLAALGASTGCGTSPAIDGVRPDRPQEVKPATRDGAKKRAAGQQRPKETSDEANKAKRE